MIARKRQNSMPTVCQLVPTVPYAPCGGLARYRCVACDSLICAKHTILHREITDSYKVGFVCLVCSNLASAPKAEACITDCGVLYNTYLSTPDSVQLNANY